MKTIDEILEIWKAFGVYALTLYYGEDIGCDDSDVPAADRRVKLLGFPVGCLGECKLLFVGTVAELRAFKSARVSSHRRIESPG